MSHVVRIKTQVHDTSAISAACHRLNLASPVQGTAELFSGNATGVIVRLADWEYPIVIDVSTGTVQFDNYDGHWGDQKHLDQFLQVYAVEKTKIEARKKGHTVTESQLENGSIKLQIQEGQ